MTWRCAGFPHASRVSPQSIPSTLALEGRVGTVSQSMNPEEPAAAKADGAANDSRIRESRRLGDYINHMHTSDVITQTV